MTTLDELNRLEFSSEFASRHIGIDPAEEAVMLNVIGVSSRRELIEAVLPSSIARPVAMQLPTPVTEVAALAELREIAGRNRVMRSFIGQGYAPCHVPAVIQRNILENPAWYTAYTPYQAEISQGRMEALVNFQTMVCDLTGMDIANASMLDEATAAAEAIMLAHRVTKSTSDVVLVAHDCHPQTIEVIHTRCAPLDIEVKVVPVEQVFAMSDVGSYFALVVQYPATTGEIHDLAPITEQAREQGALVIVAADILALSVLTPPGEWGADIVVGNTQRFGVPMGGGGPHAAFFACRDVHKRSLPGRLVGVSIDAYGQPAYRLALQTREQHIRREKATSNICTAQVLLAVMAGMYAVYHGPVGIRRIAQRTALLTQMLAEGLRAMGRFVPGASAFDTITIAFASVAEADAVMAAAVEGGANLRRVDDVLIGVSLDETTTRADVVDLWKWFSTASLDDSAGVPSFESVAKSLDGSTSMIPTAYVRSTAFLPHPVFNTHRSETQMLRYIRSLSDKDLALDRTMIPLGSCTMKLNATSEMIPVTWPEFANIHPFAPSEQLGGYHELNRQLCSWLSEATGYAGVSLQPNAGSQGEYAGLLTIRAYHQANGEAHRNVCLIPESAHGTNPASAQMAGMKVVVVRCDESGNIDLDDLRAKCELHSVNLAAAMITYPSTYGVFDTRVRELCELIHHHGGRVYVDGANMNALVGLAAPGEFGGDVSHLNLHKTFCIPHGGGGPGVGPVCVVADLVPFLPGHQSAGVRVDSPVGAVSAAPLGNAGVLPISWMYIRMMGAAGLTAATETAILNANYVAARLSLHYDIGFHSGSSNVVGGGVAHECVLDLRDLKDTSGVSAEDVAKRLIDYGFHAPTLSFPVAGTLMVEPTESESLEELDRFCDAMVAIRHEIASIEAGDWDRDDNPLQNAPHTALAVTAEDWKRAYSRDEAAYPLPSMRTGSKYWPPVGRVDNVHGDRNLFCSCIPIGNLGG
jgi:glycine dehydrogenase